jgi:PAS domain S-box-containing protein
MAGDAQNKADDLLSMFWNSTSDYACALLDPGGVVIGWKGAAYDVFGYSESEVVGKSIELIFTPYDRAIGQPGFERTMAAANGRAEDDRWHLRKDGARIWISGALLALRENDSVVGYAKVMRDRTDLKAQIEALRNENIRLSQSMAARDVTFAKITHEIRNSLSPLRNAARLLKNPGEEQQTKIAHAILDRQLAFIESMTRDLTDAARISTGKLAINKAPLDLAAELTELVNVARERATEKRQQLLLFRPDAPVIVCADRNRIHQIVFNLLDNAIKYTGPGGHIWVKCVVETDTVLLKIEDDGMGISGSMLPLIFDLFTQEAADGVADGMGIGLAVVKALVDAHDGRMEVRSDGKGKGSEFTVRLPLLKSER